MKKKGFTLIELLVVIAIIAMLLAILMPALSKVKKIAQRVICGTNLKGLGTAQNVYANDYDDEYTVQGQGGTHQVWSNITDNWYLPAKDWKTTAGGTNITIGASLYLLVREADVSPKSFVCPSSDQKEWDQKTSSAASPPDIVDVWDFGGNIAATNNQGPENCVSYAYHMPYKGSGTGTGNTGSKGRFAADGSRSASFAVMADKNPYMESKLTNALPASVTADSWVNQASFLSITTWNGTAFQAWQVKVANALPHGREGQNVLFADGHNSYETRTDVGVRNDGIYVYTTRVASPTEENRRTGLFSTTRADNYPTNVEDSVVLNDDLVIN